MGKIIVPMNNHESGFHDGHKRVIEFAKGLGNDLLIKVITNVDLWRSHLLTGTPFVTEFIHDKMNNDARDCGCSIEIANFINIPESRRQAFYNKASAFVSLYENSLLLNAYINRAIIAIMGLFAFSHSTLDRNDILAKGPEVLSFFQKSAGRLIGGPEVSISKDIVKNKSNGLREQALFYRLPEYQLHYIERLRHVIAGVKSYYKPGKNDSLVKEINASYHMKPWKVKDIAVFEGGLVSGRMEVTHFTFLTDRGLEIVEEIDYES